MRFDTLKKQFFYTGAVLLIFCLFASAQGKKEITVEWIYSDEANSIQSVPYFTWLDDNTVLILDIQKPKEKRVFERLDPATGKRTPALDMKKSVENLKVLLGEEKAPRVLPWPISFDKFGSQAIYMFGGDIFLLNLSSAQFARVTETKEVELGPTFAPDGKKIAYVRINDIYIYERRKKVAKNSSPLMVLRCYLTEGFLLCIGRMSSFVTMVSVCGGRLTPKV